jgi:hypothetical protein
MSQLEVDKIVPQSGTTLTIGDSGDTINFADGQNINIDSNTLYIDSTNNRVGIGTTSPGAKLEIQTGSDWGNIINSTNAGTQYLQQFEYNGSSIGKIRGDNSSISIESGSNLILQTANTERMRITSSGNVGIGTTSPNNQLEIKSDTATVVARLACNTGTGRDWGVASATDGAFGIYDYDAAAYRMRIDSSGNVLINTTSEATTTAGIKLRATDNSIAAVATSNPSGYFGRLSTDGDIIKLRKDSTTVGSIGVNNSDNIFIGGNVSNHSGIEFSASAVLPRNNNTLLSNTVDLGNSSVLWKDAYLSGGLYVGGTAAANKLDDYEEGTFTPTINTSTGASVPLDSGVDILSYTKIGRKVHIQGLLRLGTITSLSGAFFQIIGLPFTTASTATIPNYGARGGGGICFNSSSVFSLLPYTYSESQTRFNVYKGASTLVTADEIFVSFSYLTD